MALAAAALVVIAAVYAEVVDVYDLTTLMVSVVLPVVLGSFFVSLTRNRIMLYAYLGLIWAVLDDRPIFFDSVLTWPEVTRFNPFLPRLFMNVVIHALTVVFLYLSLREAAKGSRYGFWRSPRVLIPALFCLVLAYAQNVPLPVVQDVVQAGANPATWYPFDIVTKLLSLFFLYVALKEALHETTNVGPSSQP